MTNILCVRLPEHPEALFETLHPHADPDRKLRADGYLRKEDGLRCLVAGELLRRTVRRELGISDFRVVTEPAGKPRIAGCENFHFNLSHSGKHVVIAWGNTPVGVDVQQMRSNVNLEKMAKHWFTSEEQEYIQEIPEQERARFYRVWTGKESYLKYLGTGLKKNLASFSIFSLEPEVQLYHRSLPGGYSLTLCTSDDNYLFELLDAQRLL